MVVLRRSRLAGCAVLAAGLAVGVLAGAGTARAGSVTRAFPTRSSAVSWGAAGSGRLGDVDSVHDRLLPGAVKGLGSGVVAVAAGEFHAMALTSDGRVWTWGDNLYGELGNGTWGPGTGSVVPAPVAGLSGVVQIQAEDFSSYALRSDGTIWDWGRDSAGGIATAPVQVPGISGVTQIAIGVDTMLALRSDGTVWGWGENNAGQLGTYDGSRSDTPVQVKGLSGVTAIAAGDEMGLAVTHRKVAGAPTTLTSVWAWGDNSFGELGTSAPSPQPVPQVVPGLPQVIGIAAGVNDDLAVGADGSVWAWGNDDVGQLGNAPRNAPVMHPTETFAPGSKIIRISATYDHTLALRSDGTVLAFGRNGDGQLGTGTTSPTSLPVQVSNLAGASQVSANHNYSLAVHRAPIAGKP